MVAAQLLNQTPQNAVYGVVTSGGTWKFLALRGNELTLDLHEYRIDRLDKILGILWYIVDSWILAPIERATGQRWGLVTRRKL